jgi:hypothetical protein
VALEMQLASCDKRFNMMLLFGQQYYCAGGANESS